MKLLAPVLAVALLAWAAAAGAEPVGAGDVLEAFEIEDQHGERHRVDADVRLLLLSRDMDGGKLVREALEEEDAAFLAERAAVYLADISGMPGLIAKLFALPSMRRRDYPMLLDRDGTLTGHLPSEEGRATLVWLDALRVERIEHVDTVEAVTAALDAAADAGGTSGGGAPP